MKQKTLKFKIVLKLHTFIFIHSAPEKQMLMLVSDMCTEYRKEREIYHSKAIPTLNAQYIFSEPIVTVTTLK